MNRDLYTQVKREVLAVRDLEPAARTAHLEALGRHDPALRIEVESLLAADAAPAPVVEAASRADGLAGALAAALGADFEPMPESIGPYRILEELGEGGMGVVYRAIQTAPVHREVAIKLVKRGMDTRRIVARFESESQALALMDHPNIATVFDAGVEVGGRPYFVMELVRGEPITRWCEAHRATLDERLDLFLAVCDAVHHAHQRGIIHRDLKPSNLIVTERDGRPIPKVIDFGIAKAIQEPIGGGSLLTQAGQILGTPEYMSPEQAGLFGGGVDTRSDVYALGVVLYELLTRERPYRLDSTQPEEIRRIVSQTEPARPSTRITGIAAGGSGTQSLAKLRRRLRDDLDNIVLMALRKEPERRYGSVERFADDIRRHRSQLPVAARPDSRRYRAGKFARRHRAALVTIGAGVLLLLGGSGAVLVQSQNVRAERNRALTAEHSARLEAEAAKQVTDFLVALFEVSNPSESRGATVTAREILARGAGRVRTELRDQPIVQGRMLATIGEVHQSLGLHAAADSLLQEALRVRESALGATHPDVAATLQLLGTVRHDRGDYPGAESYYTRALDVRRAQSPADSVALASVTNELAITLDAMGRYDDAEPLYRTALDLNRRLLGERDPEIAWGTNTLGQVVFRKGDYRAADSLFQRAVALCRELHDSAHPDLAAALNNQGGVRLALADFEGAEAIFREALADYRTLYGDAHPAVGRGEHNLGLALQARGEYAAAESLFRRSLDRQQALLGAQHPYVARGMASLGSVLRDRGDFSGAEARLRQALAVSRAALGEEHPQVASVWHALGEVAHDRGRDVEAESLYSQGLVTREAALGADHPDLAATRLAWGEVRLSRGDTTAAARATRAALATCERVFPADHWRIAAAQSALGVCLAREGRSVAAESLLVMGHAGLAARFEAGDRRVRSAAQRLADFHTSIVAPERASRGGSSARVTPK